MKHYVRLFKMKEVNYIYNGTELRELFDDIEVESDARRYPEKLKTEDGVFAFRFFDQNVHECEDGEILKGSPKNFSPTYYIGELFTLEELHERFGDLYSDKIDSLVGWWHEKQIWSQEYNDDIVFPNKFVIDEDGELHLLEKNDVVLKDK